MHMGLIATTAITACISAVVGAVVGAMTSHLGRKAEASAAEDKGMREGMRALLWRELRNIHAEAAASGGLDVADRRHLENVYSAYHDIGGNGTGTRLYEESMHLPVID